MDMLEQLRSNLKAKLDERAVKKADLDSLMSNVASEGRSDFTDDEATQFSELRDAKKALDAEIDKIQGRVNELEDMATRDAERDEQAARITPTPTPKNERAVHVTNEQPIYHRGSDNSFFQDAFAVRQQMASPEASERLQRFQNEVRSGLHGQEHRAVATSAFASLVVPQYLPEMYAELLRAGRITANLCANHDLPPEGMTMTIPRGTTGTAVAAQSGENTAVTAQDFGVADITVPVRTYAGQQDVSRQSIERGRGTDELIYADLAQSYAITMDGDVINGPGNIFRHLGILQTAGTTTVTVTTAATSGPAFMRFLADAIQRVNTRRLLPADTIIMSPRRWGFMAASTDSAGRPLVNMSSHGLQNVFGIGDMARTGLVGELLGLPVWVDPNMPTTISNGTTGAGGTEDVAIVCRRSDLHLWEDSVAPRQFRFEETLGGQLTIKLVIAGYSAFTAAHHPEGIAILAGAGLTAPTF